MVIAMALPVRYEHQERGRIHTVLDETYKKTGAIWKAEVLLHRTG
jgi:hypothetical protein